MASKSILSSTILLAICVWLSLMDVTIVQGFLVPSPSLPPMTMMTTRPLPPTTTTLTATAPGGETPEDEENHMTADPFFITTTHATSKMTFKNDYGDNLEENKLPPRLRLYNGESEEKTGDNKEAARARLKLYSSLTDDQKKETKEPTSFSSTSLKFKVVDQGDNLAEVKPPTRVKLYDFSSDDKNDERDDEVQKVSVPPGTATVSPQSTLRLWSQLSQEGRQETTATPVEATKALSVVPPTLRRWKNLSEEEKAAAHKISVLSSSSTSPFKLKDQGDNLVEMKARPSTLRLYSDLTGNEQQETNKIAPMSSTAAKFGMNDQGGNLVENRNYKAFRLYSGEEKENVKAADIPSSPSSSYSVLAPSTFQEEGDVKDMVEKKLQTNLRLYTKDGGGGGGGNTSSGASTTTQPFRVGDQGDNLVEVPRRRQLYLYQPPGMPTQRKIEPMKSDGEKGGKTDDGYFVVSD